MAAVEVTVRVPTGNDRVGMLGSGDRNLKMIREALGVSVVARDGVVSLRGDSDAVGVARRVLERLGAAARHERGLSRGDVLNLIADESAGLAIDMHAIDDPAANISLAGWDGRLDVYASGRPVRPKTANQERYVTAVRENDLVFAIGPAGTGKTYLAVAAAVHLLKTARARKVILCRPAVEAGEKLGFLPGGIEAKVNPYLRPLLDALHDMMDFPTIRRFMDSDVVEVVPLAYMRGRTLNNAVIILDEAQNTTRGQMKMFLTRMGHGSKMIVNGDITQTDLPEPRESGLIDAVKRLSKTPGVGYVGFEKADVVRHPLVQRIVEAYEDDTPAP
jgi:phosphate starvation-inducible PhoH-like protein